MALSDLFNEMDETINDFCEYVDDFIEKLKIRRVNNMDPFDDLILNDIDEDVLTELEKETLKDEWLFEDLD